MKLKIFALIALFFATLNAQKIELPVAFKANFLQQVTNTKGKVIKYRGRIVFNSPSRTKWTYRSPTRKEVCTRGRKLTVIDHDLEQASYFNINRGFNLSKVLRKARHHKGNMYVTTYKGKYYTIVLDSKGQIQQIAYKDNLDNTVNIIFTSIRYRNSRFPRSKFVCAKPRSYDTVY